MNTSVALPFLCGFSLLLSLLLTAAPIERPLQIVSDPPPVQILAPGFDVQELPVELTNINNLVYAPDGRLFALAYDGNVYQLHDNDGDGLEETSSLFHDNRNNEIPESIGMDWGPSRSGSGSSNGGLYIASRGRVLFLEDKGDGSSELQTVTSGWDPPTIKGGSSLDAIGMAVDGTGNIFFSLSVDAWSAPYMINPETGQSDYNQFKERGTIIKLSPDWKQREILSTGLRFPVSLDFNANGDLFASEQEGATWLANGNPFDELLHIQKGRHYGFPPRHPQYLPGVIDEPSVFDYRPQHQSTCGLHFNEPFASGGQTFGPDWWRGDALISGESRGKIWRTKLVNTSAGYVARNSLIACLSMLTIDAITTPKGDLLVACHSGSPDWGTGPKGKGSLFRIRYTDTSAPQPAFAYAVSPTEFRIAFDRPLDLEQFKNLTSRSDITMGTHVAAGDRFESMRPGYQVVKDQMKVGRYELPVLSAAITADQREVVLLTEARVEDSNYAVAIFKDDEVDGTSDIDVLTNLNGVEAQRGNETVWLPHLDLRVARELTSASERHRNFLESSIGRSVTLRTQLDLNQMLQPAIQPGATLDYQYPLETVTVVFESDSALDLRIEGTIERDGVGKAKVTFVPKEDHWLPVELSLDDATSLSVHWYTAEDIRPRAFPLNRFKLPWVRANTDASTEPQERIIPEITGGYWQNGKKLFFSDQLLCGKCHQVDDEGGRIGPNLSNLIHRDYESVMKDINEPSAAINPDHLAYSIKMKDGGLALGVVLEESAETLTIGQANGMNVVIPKDQIEQREALSTSLMPPALLNALSPTEHRDVMTFLLKRE